MMLLVGGCPHRDGIDVRMGERAMGVPSNLIAPSAVGILSTALLCAFGSTAVAQSADSSTALPGVTVVAPKHVARPHRPERVASRPVSSTAHTQTAQTFSGSRAEAIIAGPGSTLGKLAKLEASSSNCNGGCQTSGKTGKEAWIGCSESAGYFSTFSATCTDTLTHSSYVGCMGTKVFTGWDRNRAWWYCTSLMAGGKFKVAELRRRR
jgi:hypothetical protein